jgi:hydroxypyruvate isomerase
MIKLAANLSFLFTELPFLDRFEAAARAGFSAVEFASEYEVPPQILKSRLADNQLTLALINTTPGQAGELGLGIFADRQPEAYKAFDLALQYASVLNARCIHLLAGNRSPTYAPHRADAVFLQYVCRAADLAQAVNLVLTLEPLNARDRPLYHLHTNAHAAALIKASGRPNVRLQLDLYHCQTTEGDSLRAIDKYFDLLGHVQIANTPDRAEPSPRSGFHRRVLKHLEALGYDGYVGCEYFPSADTLTSLEWASDYLQPRR